MEIELPRSFKMSPPIFRWVFPSARSHTQDGVLAFRHFVAPGEEVGVFYFDNADSLRLACREVGWRQNNSVAYVFKSNAVVERESQVRSGGD